MAEILKPSNLSVTWASNGDILDPGNTKYTTGWQVEIPPRQWFNYLDNRQDEAIAHINQHGVAVWDSSTEYQANKSYVQGPTNGTIYRCVQTNVNQNPETDLANSYWIISFASAGDFYTKVESDSRYLVKSNNGSDITNSATFRTNLGVYGKTETYTKSEVDSKTTVASAAQAQAQVSNTVLLSALRLADAFKGANQTLSTTGEQLFPGGLKVCWGSATTAANGGATFVYPSNFTNAVLLPMVCPTKIGGGVSSLTATLEAGSISLNSCTAWINTASAGVVLYFIVIGW